MQLQSRCAGNLAVWQPTSCHSCGFVLQHRLGCLCGTALYCDRDCLARDRCWHKPRCPLQQLHLALRASPCRLAAAIIDRIYLLAAAMSSAVTYDWLLPFAPREMSYPSGFSFSASMWQWSWWFEQELIPTQHLLPAVYRGRRRGPFLGTSSVSAQWWAEQFRTHYILLTRQREHSLRVHSPVRRGIIEAALAQFLRDISTTWSDHFIAASDPWFYYMIRRWRLTGQYITCHSWLPQPHERNEFDVQFSDDEILEHPWALLSHFKWELNHLPSPWRITADSLGSSCSPTTVTRYARSRPPAAR